jgi:hypothetical protein
VQGSMAVTLDVSIPCITSPVTMIFTKLVTFQASFPAPTCNVRRGQTKMKQSVQGSMTITPPPSSEAVMSVDQTTCASA